MVGFDHDKNECVSNTFLAGFYGGIVTRALVSPLDVVKIRFQVSNFLTVKSEIIYAKKLFAYWFLLQYV